jgi:hypothetical protein
MGDLPILKFKNWSIFIGDLPFLNSKKNFSKRSCFPEINLFSRWFAHFEIKKLVYFHGQPALLKFQKELQQAFMIP